MDFGLSGGRSIICFYDNKNQSRVVQLVSFTRPTSLLLEILLLRKCLFVCLFLSDIVFNFLMLSLSYVVI